MYLYIKYKMPRDIISINTTHYVGNNLYRVKLPQAVEFKKSKIR